jgi:hypothetical protein
MTGMIKQDGASLLFPTSFGYFDPYMVAMAAKETDVRFSHCGGMWTEGKHPKNTGSYFGYIDECQYLNGVVAGHMSKSKKIGFRRRQADPAGAAQHQCFHDGRAFGRIPKITTTVIFTGEWSMPVKEGRGHQQPRRPGHRRLHDARRRPEGRSSRPPPSAARWSAATTPARPSSRPTPTSPAPSGTGAPPTRPSSTPR